MLGAWYVGEALKLNTAREEKIKAAGDVETDETKASLALVKGYTDRAMDAYARALKSAGGRDMPKTYKDGLNNKLVDLFDSRYDGKHDGIEQLVAGVMNRPLPDPETPVTPVIEQAPVQAPPPPAVKSVTKQPTPPPATKSVTKQLTPAPVKKSVTKHP